MLHVWKWVLALLLAVWNEDKDEVFTTLCPWSGSWCSCTSICTSVPLGRLSQEGPLSTVAQGNPCCRDVQKFIFCQAQGFFYVMNEPEPAENTLRLNMGYGLPDTARKRLFLLRATQQNLRAEMEKWKLFPGRSVNSGSVEILGT